MEKQKYEAPDMEVIRFNPEDDVVCTSGLTDGGTGNGGNIEGQDNGLDGLGLGL